MTITNEPIVIGEPVKFKVLGFPEELAIRASIERFYSQKSDAFRDFFIFNSFNEQIFSGHTGDNGKIEKLEVVPKRGAF